MNFGYLGIPSIVKCSEYVETFVFEFYLDWKPPKTLVPGYPYIDEKLCFGKRINYTCFMKFLLSKKFLYPAIENFV